MRIRISICQTCFRQLPESMALLGQVPQPLICVIPCPACDALVQELRACVIRVHNPRPKSKPEDLAATLYAELKALALTRAPDS